ncbi:hypothetical protein DRW41_11425 [Neobacillus piezotolerans]|uniref:Transporter n=1 Tax=Neobacillus piezotolerans TaxID=2259171 RepID=A0A3D8GQP8_9BACI|nr:hypothetical protein [Neobacillus piezotolerans]RDU36825.1 hypothetical protein DRW41_11425 [Neobacillus piezotolerans]
MDHHNYISGTVKLGVSFGVVSLLARWVTGNTILSSPQTLIQYGLIGGIGYSLVGAFCLILFGLLAKKIYGDFPNQQTIGDVLQQRLTANGYWCMMTVLLFTSLCSLFIQAAGAGIVIHMIFPIPVFLGMLVFLSFCFFIGGIGGMQRLHQLAGVNVTVIFAAVLIIPVYFFIQDGIYPVYDGIKLYHPYLFYIKNTDAFWFIFTAIFVFFGQILIDPATWQRIFILKKSKIRLTFALTGLIWATIPLAFSSLLMIVLFGKGFENIYSLFPELVNKIQSTVLILLFVVFCLSAIASAISAELTATTSLFVKNIMGVFHTPTNEEKWKYTILFSGAICLVLLIIVAIQSPAPVKLLFFFGNIYAAIISPMLMIILSKKVQPFIVPFSAIIGASGGSLLLLVMDDFAAILLSFALSTIICLIVLLYRFLNNKRIASQ